MLLNKILSFIVLMTALLLVIAAPIFIPETMPYSTIASYAVSTRNLENVPAFGSYAYQPWFENSSWQGDLVQYDLSATGEITTTVNFNTDPPTNVTNTNGKMNWSARLQFDRNSKKYLYYKNHRKIITTTGTGVNATQIAFEWNALSSSQQLSLDAAAINNSNSDILDFIRGDRSNEINRNSGGVLRQRYSILGDIIHSDPIFVAKPNSLIFDPGYALYKKQNVLREPRVYVGANDGMLHVFNANTGDEVYAYIPSMLINKLKRLSQIPYQHQYYVDGGLSVGDMDFANQNWHSILVGALGAGEKGLFALDITNEDLMSESSRSALNNKVLWEIGGSNPDIGYITNKSEIVKLPDGHWYVVIGNGYGSSRDVASLLLINSSGVVSVIEADNAVLANGLSGPTLIDINGDGMVDFAYAGDLKGNLYRFDLKSKLKAVKLFSSGSGKSITTAPLLVNNPAGGRIILFATGRLLSDSDVNDRTIQSIYGIQDFDVAQLISNTKIYTRTLSNTIDIINPITKNTVSLRHIVNSKPQIIFDWLSFDGWKLDLKPGERVVLAPNLRASRFQVMSINPVSKEAWLIQLNFYDGEIKNIIYDLNGDAIYDAADTINFPVDSAGIQTGFGDIPVAINQGIGSFSRQLITRVKNGVDANLINGLGLPVITLAKTGKVTAGFARGHIDVDTDSPHGGSLAERISDQYCYELGNRASGVKIDAAGTLIPPSQNSPFVRTGSSNSDGLSGRTDGHQHEYDKAHGTVDVDYINLELHCKQTRADNKGLANVKLNRVTEVAIGNATEFFVIVANADLSPAAQLNIANESWNAVVYQKLIQKKLDAWKKSGAIPDDFKKMMTDNGASLIYTLNNILDSVKSGTGKFSNSFTNRAIIDGELHPTQMSCVKESANITNGRWRNGSLVVQLISVKNYLLDPSTVLKQKPTDLVSNVSVNGIDIVLIEPNGNYYGGLYANNKGSNTGIADINSAFLYESTLFWHFGALYTLDTGLAKPCYGDVNWSKAKAFELAGISSKKLSSYLNDSTNSLGKAKQKLLAAIASGQSQEIIDRLQREFDSELNTIQAYVNGVAANDIQNKPSIIGTPVLTHNLSVTSQHKIRQDTVGRRSWIDIPP